MIDNDGIIGLASAVCAMIAIPYGFNDQVPSGLSLLALIAGIACALVATCYLVKTRT